LTNTLWSLDPRNHARRNRGKTGNRFIRARNFSTSVRRFESAILLDMLSLIKTAREESSIQFAMPPPRAQTIAAPASISPRNAAGFARSSGDIAADFCENCSSQR